MSKKIMQFSANSCDLLVEMKSAVLFGFVVCVVCLIHAQEYPTKDIDVDEVLKNDRLVDNYISCLLDKGPCTPEGEELKGHIKEALSDGCAKCNDDHKEGIRKVITHLVQNKKEAWDELQAKYDPDGTYKDKYADLLKEVE